MKKLILTGAISYAVIIALLTLGILIAASGNDEPENTNYINGIFIWPSEDSHSVTSLYGGRYHPVTGEYTHHAGIDIGAAFGTDVLAADGGTVVLSQYYGTYGNCVIVDHGNGYTTLYAHMDQLAVEAGASVSQGQTVGYVGSTGRSTGPHLHFEVRYHGTLTDPLSFSDLTLEGSIR